MPQQHHLELLSCEDRIILAIKAIQSDATMSQRRAAATYNVPQSTLNARCTSQSSRRDIQPNQSKLSKLEEETIIQYIRKLNARGFAPTFTYVRSMANQLLAARSSSEVRVN
jgi:hypothetical protein